MDHFYPVYMVLWIAACVVAGFLYVRDREAYVISHRAYWRYLAVPWKLATFLISATGLTVIAPYTGDPTWDHVDSIVMSILCYATAPWTVGAIYKAIRRELPLRQAYVAACVWMFSVSWFYDTYILMRDGEYSPLWFPNIFASSVLYLCAGLLWNLDWKAGRGTIFGFMESDWPSTAAGPVFHKIMWVGLIFMVIVGLMILPFLFDQYIDFSQWFAEW